MLADRPPPNNKLTHMPVIPTKMTSPAKCLQQTLAFSRAETHLVAATTIAAGFDTTTCFSQTIPAGSSLVCPLRVNLCEP